MIPHVQVSCRNQLYSIENVSTVKDLKAKLKKASGLKEDCRLIFQGDVVEEGPLSKYGIRDGSTMIALSGSSVTFSEFLAVWLDMTNNPTFEKWSKLLNNSRFREAMKDDFHGISGLSRQGVADSIRSSLDAGYHTLRRGWEHPKFRQTFSDPIRIEGYRKVVATFLSKKVLSHMHPSAKSIVQSPEEWRKQFIKLTSDFIQAGDVILDGILEVILDVLKGAGRAATSWRRHQQTYEPSMEDPNLANELLFELSESDDE